MYCLQGKEGEGEYPTMRLFEASSVQATWYARCRRPKYTHHLCPLEPEADFSSAVNKSHRARTASNTEFHALIRSPVLLIEAQKIRQSRPISWTSLSILTSNMNMSHYPLTRYRGSHRSACLTWNFSIIGTTILTHAPVQTSPSML